MLFVNSTEASLVEDEDEEDEEEEEDGTSNTTASEEKEEERKAGRVRADEVETAVLHGEQTAGREGKLPGGTTLLPLPHGAERR